MTDYILEATAKCPIIVFIAWPPFNAMMLLIQPFRFSLPRPLQAIRRDVKNTVDHSLNFEAVSVLKFQFCLLTRPVGCAERLNSLRDADT